MTSSIIFVFARICICTLMPSIRAHVDVRNVRPEDGGGSGGKGGGGKAGGDDLDELADKVT